MLVGAIEGGEVLLIDLAAVGFASRHGEASYAHGQLFFGVDAILFEQRGLEGSGALVLRVVAVDAFFGGLVHLGVGDYPPVFRSILEVVARERITLPPETVNLLRRWLDDYHRHQEFETTLVRAIGEPVPGQ